MADNNTNLKNNEQEKELDQIVFRKNKLQNYKDLNIDPFGQKFEITHHSKDILTEFSFLKEEEICQDKLIKIAGRIVSIRKMGKASFFHIKDREGKIQCYIKKDVVGDDNYALFKLADLGDIVGITGHIMRTQTGEITLRVSSYQHLVKALRPIPDKFHGLNDIEIRSRKRYLDLISNDQSMTIAITRPKIIRGIQKFLDNRNYIEVETPVLNPILGGASAKPFITHHNALNQDFYLRIATELNLKRLLVGGMERVYEIGRLFRNEGIDQTHNPEFTTIELYEAYGDLSSMMDIAENLIRTLAKEIRGTTTIEWGNETINLEPEFKKITMVDAIKEKIGIDFTKVTSDNEAIELSKKYGVEIESHFTYGHIINAFFEKFCEEDMIQPTFVMNHPIEISPLTKKDPKDPRFTQRFELYINRKEIANAYTELNDPIDQKERFIEQLKERNKGNVEANDMDNDFVEALEYGMPPAGGMGIGIDRLVMFLTSTDQIREVILFPTLKSNQQTSIKTIENFQEKEETSQQTSQLPKANNLPDLSNIVIDPLFTDYIDFETFQKSDFRVVKVINCEAVNKSKKLLKFTLNDGSDKPRTILSGIHEYYEPEQLIGRTCVAITNLPPRKMMGIDSEGMLISAVCKNNEKENLNLLMLDDCIPAGAKLC